MHKKRFILVHQIARNGACEYVRNAPDGYFVTIQEPTRSLEANAAQWPILEAFSEQLKWPVNGAMVRMTSKEWKDVLTAAFRRETARLAMGLDGGVVMLGASTREFGKKEFGEWLEFLHQVAADRGIELMVPA